jgi:hypothetical protein
MKKVRPGRLADFTVVFPPHLTRKRKQIGRQGNHIVGVHDRQ